MTRGASELARRLKATQLDPDPVARLLGGMVASGLPTLADKKRVKMMS